MRTRILLVQPKPEKEPEVMLATLRRFHLLRQEWPGIIDLTVGETTSSDYPYVAIVRFVEPHISINVVNSPEYQKVFDELQTISTAVLTLDMNQEGREDIPTPAAYGSFSPTVEERLRKLVYLWCLGTGQPLTSETTLDDLPQPNDFGINLVEFDAAAEQEFGVTHLSDILTSKGATFRDLLSAVETHLKKTLENT